MQGRRTIKSSRRVITVGGFHFCPSHAAYLPRCTKIIMKIKKITAPSSINTLGALAAIFFVSLILAILPDFITNVHLPCILKRVFCVNCPFCGMTRDFILMAKGLLPKHNPFSAFFALLIFFIYPLSLGFFVLRRQKINIQYLWVRNIFVLSMTVMFIVNNLR